MLETVNKPFAVTAAIAGGILSIGGAWKLLELPVPATRAWVVQVVDPFNVDAVELLKVKRRLYAAELYSYEVKTTADPTDHMNIDRLKDELAAIDRQLAVKAK